jgi:hypothetical protein
VRNACHNHNKQHSRSRDNQTDDETAIELLEAGPEYIPEESLLKSELDDELIVAMGKLPESYRQALYFYFYKQLSYAEIADVLEITKSTVSTNIMKGKAKLKELLEKTSDTGFGDADFLRGVAIGPAIAHAFFEDDVVLNVGASEIEGFVNATNSRIDAQIGTLNRVNNVRRVTARHGIGSGAIAAILVGVAVVVTSIILLVNPLDSVVPVADGSGQETPVVTAPVSEAKVEIVMTSSDENASDILNPVSASLVTDNGAAENWRILDVDGTTVYSGSGDSVSSELLLLKSGKYTLEWKNIRDDSSIATATRIFEVNR